MDFHQENADVYPRDDNWHKDFINMPLVIKALGKTYADSGQDANSRKPYNEEIFIRIFKHKWGKTVN